MRLINIIKIHDPQNYGWAKCKELMYKVNNNSSTRKWYRFYCKEKLYVDVSNISSSSMFDVSIMPKSLLSSDSYLLFVWVRHLTYFNVN